MMHFNIKLEKVTDVKEFYTKACKYDEMYLHQNKTQIPATTLLGIYTLDLEQPVKLVFPDNDTSLIERIASDFEKWVVK